MTMSIAFQEAEPTAKLRPGKRPARAKKRRQRRKFLPHHQLPVAGLAEIAPPPDPVRFLSKAEVIAIVRATYPSIHEWMRRGTFPLPRVLSGNVNSRRTVIAWLAEDIIAWARSRPKRPPGMLGGVGRKK
jgi:predicted DNA-binding transcriptional regulator AlpA